MMMMMMMMMIIIIIDAHFQTVHLFLTFCTLTPVSVWHCNVMGKHIAPIKVTSHCRLIHRAKF
jgi:hypothetical protein